MLKASDFVKTADLVTGATYYVDYDEGSDTSSGMTPATAWKHCPGDEQAADKAAAAKLQAGDAVIFKGGVRYRGKMSKPFSGEIGQPLVYDGNTAGDFGAGPAIIDGSSALTDWKRCKSAEEAEGNPRFSEIWYTDIEYSGGWRGLNLLGPEKPLAVSQDPNPEDPMFQESMNTYYRAEMALEWGKDSMHFSDPKHLANKPDDYYTGMGFVFHGGHNMAVYVTVTGFDAETQTLTTTPMKIGAMGKGTYKKGTTYSFFNSVKIIDRPGEYAMRRLTPETARVFVWPTTVEGDQPVDISRSEINTGFDLKQVNYVRVRGFKIERQGGKNAHGVLVRNSKNIQLEHCEISQVRGSAGFRASQSEGVSVKDCYIHHLPGHTFGLFMRGCSNVEVIRTRIHKPTSTALDYYNVEGGTVSQCEISGFTGKHANGMTFYLGYRDLLIERNYVHSGNIPLTIKQSGDVMIRNNIFDANGSMAIGMWSTSNHEKNYWKGPTLQNVKIMHNILINGHPTLDYSRGIFSNMKNQPDGLVVKNNILAGVHGRLNGDYSHNIYTNNVGKAFMGEGCGVVEDVGKLFVDAENGDFRPAAGSPAIGAGVDMGVEDDFEGNPRRGKNPTIGAYAAE